MKLSVLTNLRSKRGYNESMESFHCNMHICTFHLVFTLLLKILILISNKTLLDLYLLPSLGETHWKLFLNMECLSLISSLVFRLLQLDKV